MRQAISQVDAFTNKPFAGNPAGVCIMQTPANEEWMQQVAAEMNLAETAFLYCQDDGYHLRWFTPLTEVDLCGHATLASAHILWEEGHLQAGQQARFYTKSGLLTANREGDWIELTFPALPEQESEPPDGLLEALGISQPRYIGKSRFDYIIEVANEDELLALKPNFTALKKVETRGIIVTSQASRGGFDFVSRFFVPAIGIDEDPVTGSAHCVLTPYWSKRLTQTRFNAFQASKRGGVLQVRLDGDKVQISGQAVTVLSGHLLTPQE